MRISFACVLVAGFAGCAGHQVTPPPTAPKRPSFTASHVRAFTDTFAVTSVTDTSSNLWVGSTHGLLRWDLAGGARYTVIGPNEGLPAERVAAVASDSQGGVWVATEKGLSRGFHGSWSNLPPAPVGPFVTGLVPSLAGKGAWAGGPEGLARMQNKKWERYLSDTSVTALAMDPSGTLWVGTGGKGILRVPPSADRIEQFSAAQGCETDVVRGLVATDKGVLAVGDGAGEPRAALFDGERFHSYKVVSPSVLEWAVRAGDQYMIGAGDTAYILTMTPWRPDLPPPHPSAIRLEATHSMVVKEGKLLNLKSDLSSVALEEPGPPTLAPKVVAKNAPPLPQPPRLDAVEYVKLPEGITAVAGSDRGLLVGTRFLGVVRVENGVLRRFRATDLTTGAERITVACGEDTDSECYLATGSGRAWRFDGQSFEVADVDPEPNARVLAVVKNPKGEVLALHRGASDPHLRISVVDKGKGTPVSMQAVEVPVGVPDLNFAAFAPSGHLWLGLRYFDKELDPVDFGAAEVALDTGKVLYHRQDAPEGAGGLALPNDTVAMYWRAPNEGWFATRSGVARVLDGQVRMFTENDNLESELIQDIGPGEKGEIWVATRHGVGRWDGKYWQFPKLGPFYLHSTSLGHDENGHVFLGTEKGLYCLGDCSLEPIDSKRGLLDDSVTDLTVDARGRVWVLTEKGISIIDP
jgi:Two component regulator propeller